MNDQKSGWGTPNQAKVLVIVLVVLALVILWAVVVMNDAEFESGSGQTVMGVATPRSDRTTANV